MGSPITIKRRVGSPKNPASEQASPGAGGTISGRTMNVKLSADEAPPPSADSSSGVSGRTVHIKLPEVATQKKTAARDAPTHAETAPDEAVFLSPPEPTGNFKGGTNTKATAVYTALALIATLLFLSILLFQWLEFRDLQFFFPRPLQLGALVRMLPW